MKGAPPPHLALVGLPGAGKSTVGRLLAERLGAPFLDFDEELERREGMPVAEIFARRGEEYFRGLESDLTREVRAQPAMVLAPGGGWAANSANVALIRPPARIIYLRVGIEAAVSRLGTKLADRPLLHGDDPRSRLSRLLSDRGPAYARADHEIDTEPLDPQEVANLAGDLATRWGWPIG